MAAQDSLIDRVARVFVPIHSEGQRFAAIGVGVTLVAFLFSGTLGWIAGLVTLWIAYFFRDPDRVVPQREGLVVSAADGTIEAIDEVTPESEFDFGTDRRVRVSVYLGLFDVHIQRAPVSGRLVHTVYIPGTFGGLRRAKAHEDNERQINVFEMSEGTRVAMVQIAGGIRRRIVSFIEGGARAGIGDRVGMIRFGSRVDIYLPPGVRPLVCVGQKAIAGETVIADMKSGEPERSARSI